MIKRYLLNFYFVLFCFIQLNSQDSISVSRLSHVNINLNYINLNIDKVIEDSLVSVNINTLPNTEDSLYKVVFKHNDVIKTTKSIHDFNLLFSKKNRLIENELLEFFVIFAKENHPEIKWKISLRSSIHELNRKFKNKDYLALSIHKSISNSNIETESSFTDLLIKFNISKNNRWFSLIGLDISLSELTFQGLPSEAMLNVNYFLGSKKIKKEVNRKFFIGGGTKIFNNKILTGGHIGSLEIDGPLFTSYLFGGYYYHPYKESLNFSHNLYAEFVLSLHQKTKIDLLSDIRIKFGILMPTGNHQQSNVQATLGLEIPIGGVQLLSE